MRLCNQNVYKLHCCDVNLKNVSFDKLREDLRIEIQKNLNTIAMDLVKSASVENKKREQIEELKKKIDNLLEIASKGGGVADLVYEKIDAKQQKINEIELDLFLNKRITDRLHIDYSIPINYNLIFYENMQFD